jgi:hypothetical protein
MRTLQARSGRDEPIVQSDIAKNPHWRASVSITTARRVAGTVLSQHRTSMGLVRYRWWEGSITVELLLLDEPTAILAVVPGSDRPHRRSTA